MSQADSQLIDGGQATVDVLLAGGVSHFFTVPGESFLPVLEALRNQDRIQVITNRQESGAAFAAEAFAKISGRPAACMVTRGPGASNLSIGIHTAFYDSTPLLALVGLVPTEQAGTGAFQEFDLASMFGSLSKRAVVVPDRDGLEQVIAEALRETLNGTPGPVVVGMPTDVIGETASRRPYAVNASRDADADIATLIDLLRKASRPGFVMATEAVRGVCAADVGELATALDAPVVCAWRRYSAFDNGHPLFAGSLGLGMSPAVPATLDECDVVIAFGPLEQITVESGRLNRRGLTVVNVQHGRDHHLAHRLQQARLLQLEASPADVARRLAASDLGSSAMARTHRSPSRPRGEPESLTEAVIAHLDRVLPANAIVTSDAGDFAHPILRQFTFNRDRSFVGPVVGAMGYGLPSALGSRLAAPRRPVYCLAGDGGFLMTAGEMETAVRHGIDVTAVVFNNCAYGTIRRGQTAQKPGSQFATGLGEVRFADLARAMGWAAWTTRSLPEFVAACQSAERASGCRLIEVNL